MCLIQETYGIFNGNAKSWSQWRSMGFDVHGKNADPKFTSISGRDFSLEGNSPGIDAGQTQGNPFNIDMIGVSRPQGSAFDMGAYEYSSNPNPDMTPPEVTGASIANATTVIVNFSEALDQSTAQNPSNYTINNSITVNNAVLSTDKKMVTLTTSPHSNGQDYIITVSNLKDLAGNIISPSANTAGYSFFNDTTPPQLVGASLTGRTHLTVTFTEEMNQTTIENASNYGINNGVSIISATAEPGNKSVILNTTPESAGEIYTLTVNNVKDLAGNPIAPERNSTNYWTSLNKKYSIIGARAQWYQDYTPLRAIDNNPDPTSQSRWGGLLTLPDSIIFSLDDNHTINEIHLSFFRWNFGRVYNYSLYVSEDSINWTRVVSNEVSVLSEWTNNAFTPIKGSFVKLVLLSCNESQFAGLWEAEILGPDQSVGIKVDEGTENPSGYQLEQNYPNPFNPTTNINFNIPADQQVKINIYNSLGELVTTLVNRFYPAGRYDVTFDASNLPSGVYIYRIESESFTASKKMMLVK